MKFVINSLSEVPEAFHAEYEARSDGKFQLKGEGDYPPLVEANTKLAQFRDNNRTLNTKVTELETKLRGFDGIDPAEHTALKTKVSELEKTGVKGKDDVAEMIKAAVKAATAPLEENLRQRAESEAAAQRLVEKQTLENKLREVGSKNFIEDGAMRDFINRASEVFKLVDGELVARKGDAPIFSKKRPAEELTPDEWALDILKPEAPFLFKPSKGTGARNGSGEGSNFTGQRKVVSSDPMEFGMNLEAIAKGEAVVEDN